MYHRDYRPDLLEHEVLLAQSLDSFTRAIKNNHSTVMPTQGAWDQEKPRFISLGEDSVLVIQDEGNCGVRFKLAAIDPAREDVDEHGWRTPSYRYPHDYILRKSGGHVDPVGPPTVEGGDSRHLSRNMERFELAERIDALRLATLALETAVN